MVGKEAIMNNKDHPELRNFGLAGWTEKMGSATCDRCLKSEYLRGIAFLHAAGTGGWKAGGVGVWADDRMEDFVKRVLTSHIGRRPRKVIENRMEGYFWLAFITLAGLFSFSLVLLAVCLFERMHLLVM